MQVFVIFGFLCIRRMKIYQQILGQGHQTILFIHGLGSSTLDWEHQVEFFSKNYKTITVDLRGHGRTGSVEGAYNIHLFAKDVAEILKNEIHPVHIIGISMGGMVALQLATDIPERIKSLVIINSYVDFPLDNPEMIKALRKRKLIPKILGMRIMGLVIGKKLFPRKDQRDLRILMAKRWAKNKVKDYIKSVDAIAGWSIINDLHKITCPVLVLTAEFDYWSVEEKRAYTTNMPKAKLVVIKSARHGVTMEKPDEVNMAINKFLNSAFQKI